MFHNVSEVKTLSCDTQQLISEPKFDALSNSSKLIPDCHRKYCVFLQQIEFFLKNLKISRGTS